MYVHLRSSAVRRLLFNPPCNNRTTTRFLENHVTIGKKDLLPVHVEFFPPSPHDLLVHSQITGVHVALWHTLVIVGWLAFAGQRGFPWVVEISLSAPPLSFFFFL